MKFFYRRVVLTIVTIFYSTLNALAEVDGRWYSLDGISSPPSPFRMVVGGILAIVVGVFFALCFFPLDKRDKGDNTLGCLSITLIIGGVIVILFGFSRCSG